MSPLIQICLLLGIQVRDSGVHGKGVFAKQDIPSGTVLGTYPGVARSVPAMVAKANSILAARDYIFVSGATILAATGGFTARFFLRRGLDIGW
jgi:hypothetical protein